MLSLFTQNPDGQLYKIIYLSRFCMLITISDFFFFLPPDTASEILFPQPAIEPRPGQ